MRKIVFAVLGVALINFSVADEDGRYRPEVQGNYFRPQNGRYRSLVDNVGKYSSALNGYQPYYQAQQLNRQLLAPNGNYDNRLNQNYYASLAGVTNPTVIPAVTTIRPRVYSTTLTPVLQPTKLPVYTRTQYNSDKSANIIEQDSDSDGNNYRYSYQTDNGIAAGESGTVDTSSNGGGTRVRGFYEYIGDDGLKYRVDYTADENGFRPSGAHLPQN